MRVLIWMMTGVLVLTCASAGVAQDDAPPGDRPGGPRHHPHPPGPPRSDPGEYQGEHPGEHRGELPGAGLPGVPGVELTQEEMAETVEVMRQLSPWWADRLEEARSQDEGRYRMMVQRAYPRLRRLLELRRQDPALYELRVAEARYDSESRRLSWRLHEARRQPDQADEVRALESQLREVLAKQFDVVQQARLLEVESLKNRIGRLETELDERQANREELIAQRYEDLLAGAKRTEHRKPRGEERGRPPGPDMPPQIPEDAPVNDLEMPADSGGSGGPPPMP